MKRRVPVSESDVHACTGSYAMGYALRISTVVGYDSRNRVRWGPVGEPFFSQLRIVHSTSLSNVN